MTLLESYIGKYLTQNKKRYIAFFKLNENIIPYQFEELDNLQKKIEMMQPHWNFDKLSFIALKDKTRTPPIKPIDESELKTIENMFKGISNYELISSTYIMHNGVPKGN